LTPPRVIFFFARVCDFSEEDRVTYGLDSLQIDPLIIHLVGTQDNKCPSPESNSIINGDSAQKKSRTQHRVFTGVEKKLLEEQYKSDQLNEKKSREVVTVLISSDGKTLSEEQVKSWVDNLKISLKKKKGKECETNDQK
jgi:hypothetical protein